MLEALKHEIELRSQLLPPNDEKVRTLYFGGGTPSILSRSELEILIGKVASHFDLSDCEEITLEANPEDISAESLQHWFDLGINRLSVGIQSFDSRQLQYTNRCHDALQSRAAIELIKASNIDNFTIDLMFGIPGATKAHWVEDLRTALSFEIPHLSVYGLTIEPNTVFGNWNKKGKLSPSDEELMTWFFTRTHQTLIEKGYEHYEVSNYALPSKRSKHNTAYWQGQQYIGIGPGAHSFDGQERCYNISNNVKYIRSLSSGQLPQTFELLTKTDRINEIIFTSLRTIEGLNLQAVMQEFGKDLLSDHRQEISDWEKMNLMEVHNEYLRLTVDGMLLTDEISLKLLYS